MAVRASIRRVLGRPKMLSDEQMRALLEEKAQRRFGMSADEFIERLDRGDLPDDSAVNELAILVGQNAG